MLQGFDPAAHFRIYLAMGTLGASIDELSDVWVTTRALAGTGLAPFALKIQMEVTGFHAVGGEQGPLL